MNLSDAVNIRFGGKTVESIRIDGRTVYNGLNIVVSSDKSFILTGETATVTVYCEDLPDTEIELYKVINMTRTLWDTLTTDSTGTASKVYTGTGAGEVGFVAVYDEKDSNIVVIDDYVPAVDSVGLAISNSNVSYGASVTLTATVKDQHNQNITSGTVTFKDGSTTIGTGSVSSGVATLTISTLAVGSHSLTAEISSKTSSAVSLSVNKLNTATTITPPTLYYKDEFDVEGTLKDSNGTGIVGATVTLLWNDGSDHTATATTGTGGAYSFHRDAPTSIREYTFKVTYAGGDNYNASETGTSSVTVNKELTVINITSPTSGTTVNNDFTVTGTLLDDEGAVLDTSASVDIYHHTGNAPTLLGSATVGVDGAFSYTVPISSLTATNNWINVVYSASSNYAGGEATIKVIKSTYDGMSIEKSAGKDILSYADSGATPETEYCTVRTQLKSGSSSANISGVPVVFGAYQNDVLVTGSEQTVNTDANGQATYTYVSAGRGDVVVKAVPDNRILLTKTYTISDIAMYDKGITGNKSSAWTSVGSLTEQVLGTGTKLSSSVASDCYYKANPLLTGDFSVEFDLVDGYAWEFMLTLLDSNNNKIDRVIGYNSVGSTHRLTVFNASYQGQSYSDYNHTFPVSCKLVREGSNLKFYENDSLKATTTISTSDCYFAFIEHSDANRYTTFKDLKIKQL